MRSDKETVLTDNELIAKFMGAQLIQVRQPGLPNELRCYALKNPPKGLHDLQSNCGLFHTALQFDTSWDWLMPVVENISEYRIAYPEQANEVCNVKIVVLKQVLYKRVVEFIKWYNENTKV